MDDGKAAGPKLKWWSRPGHTPDNGPAAGAGPEATPPAGAGPQAIPPADGPAGAAPADASGTAAISGVREPADGGVRSREASASEAPGAGAEPAPAAPAPPADQAQPVSAPAPGALPASPAPSVPPQRPQPLHPEDPYGTPPYGGPGPWAPAPPVQRPVATPAHGTVLPPAAGPMPPYGPPAPAPAPAAGYPVPPQSPPPAAPQGAGGSGTAVAPGRPGSAPGVPGAPGDDRPPAGPDGAQPHPTGPTSPADPAQPQPQPQVTAPAGQGPDRTSAAPAAPPAPPAAPLVALAPQGAWQQYDPWSAPLQGGPAVPPPTARRGRRGPLAVGAVALALLAGGIGGGVGAYVERYGGLSDIELPQADDDAGGRNPGSVAGIAQAALPGVVTLHVRGNTEQGTGTGFVLDRQGHILTNNHVVEPAGTGGEISVTFSGGQAAKAKVIGRDRGYDLAVVQVQGVAGLRPLALGNSDTVRVGDPVVAIGAPYDLANTVTAGIISAKERPITAGGEKGDGSDLSYVDALQTDAPINPGNSGGPLVDAKARVIGINSAIRAADTGSGPDSGQGGSIGLGFAIPVNQAKRVAEELINTGRATHPVIGVTLEMEYDGDGARVSRRGKGGKEPVSPGGPGAKAGIRAGDVITKVDGATVHSGEELIVRIRSHRPGDTLMLTLHRGGKEQSMRLTLGSSTAD
ncbi:S1C family serine protease [Streptomyces sp. NPDC001339]|uniref:S1C family serine protease n=1 Tax=Streptomyces sp. NPDC001339 TaxID=3364563 RepID=UPI0036A30407